MRKSLRRSEKTDTSREPFSGEGRESGRIRPRFRESCDFAGLRSSTARPTLRFRPGYCRIRIFKSRRPIPVRCPRILPKRNCTAYARCWSSAIARRSRFNSPTARSAWTWARRSRRAARPFSGTNAARVSWFSRSALSDSGRSSFARHTNSTVPESTSSTTLTNASRHCCKPSRTTNGNTEACIPRQRTHNPLEP